MRSAVRSCVAPLALFALAVLYFSFSRNLTLDLTDEGQIVYPSWLVATGAVPNRDFRHMYGPSLFLLNGSLFALFGADLAVLRWALVLLKAGVATAVFLGSRMVATTPFALLSYVICVAVWGTPWWVFNTPYANHYALLLNFAGLLAFWVLRRRLAVASFVAGISFGLATTFKLTSGVFALSGLVLFLIWASPSGQPNAPSSGSDRVGRGVRLLALLAVALIAGAYLAQRNTVWNVTMLSAPLVVTLFCLARRELSGAVEGGASRDSVIAMLSAAAGMLMPLLGYITYYFAVGGLSPLLADLLLELPSRTRWFDPLGAPQWRPTLFALGVIGALGAVRLWREPVRGYRLLAVLSSAVAAGAAVLLARDTMIAPGMRAYALMMYWHHDVLPLTFVIPFLVVWACSGVVLWGTQPREVTAGVALLFFFAVTSLLFLYPAADFWHAVMGLPAFLPLLAFQLGRVSRSARGLAGAVAAALACTAAAAYSAPFVDTLRYVIRAQPPSAGALVRATGVVDASPQFQDTVQVVNYVDSQPGDVTMFALANEQMLYFLSGRRSVLSGDEFVLYLVGVGAIADQDARALVDEQQALARVATVRPIVVVDDRAESTARFRSVFAQLAAYIDTHYRSVKTIGRYRVLQWGAS